MFTANKIYWFDSSIRLQICSYTLMVKEPALAGQDRNLRGSIPQATPSFVSVDVEKAEPRKLCERTVQARPNDSYSSINYYYVPLYRAP